MWAPRGDQPVIPGVPWCRLSGCLPQRQPWSLLPTGVPAQAVTFAVRLGRELPLPYCVSTCRTLCAPPFCCGRLPSQENSQPVPTAHRTALGHRREGRGLALAATERQPTTWISALSATAPGALAAVKVHRVLLSRPSLPASSRACHVRPMLRRDSEAVVTPLMQDASYAPRSFATLGPSELRPPLTCGSGFGHGGPPSLCTWHRAGVRPNANTPVVC